MLSATLAFVAIVATDNAALRAAPKNSATEQAMLWQGDTLEIRGEKGDYLQVYDHRRERAGYILARQVKLQSLQPEAAPELLNIVHFLRDNPGDEALGIAYAAAFLRAAPAEAINGDIFDALGTMADRLADRATSGSRNPQQMTAHLEVAAQYGVHMRSVERDGHVLLCSDGEAQRRVMALPAHEEQRARAALSLTRSECIDPSLGPIERFNQDNWRREVLDRVQLNDLPPVLRNRVHLRKAEVWASLTYQHARRPELGSAAIQEAAEHALDELAAIDKTELMESDAADYNDAAIRVGASRWGAAPPPSEKRKGLAIHTTSGKPGETCVQLIDDEHGPDAPLLSHCTWGVVWTASAAIHPRGKALALAVQPLEDWREMWIFREEAGNWTLEVLPPAPDAPHLGYVEFAGWVPGKSEFLAAREVRSQGNYRRRFELLSLDTLETLKEAWEPNYLSTFYRWQAPEWKAGTVALR